MDEEMDLEMVSTSPQAQPVKKFKVKLKIVGDGLNDLENHQDPVVLKLNCNSPNKRCQADFYDGDKQVLSVMLSNSDQIYQSGDNFILLRISRGSALVQLMSSNDTNQLLQQIQSVLSPGATRISKQSVFSLRTEEASAKQYFQFYGFLAQQQNMMQDYVRTSTYQSAMLQNTADFKDKVVMDVGAGSGVLSFFAVQAGAKKVYAVEASSMAVHCHNLVQSNRVDHKVTIIAGKVEEIDVPEKVDVIISEPMGYMLFNERMLESYLHAKKWLKPEGKMYPTQAILYCAPFTDDMLYMEQFNKATFWCQQHFHSIDLSALRDSAMEEYFKQPIVDTFDMRILLAKPLGHKVDFLHSSEDSLHNIFINLNFDTWSSGGLHGVAFWFDVAFMGSQQTVWLSTAPFQPLTHWYQVRCLLKKPLFVQVGQKITGSIMMKANERQSYDIDIELSLVGTALSTKSSYDLKNPYFRYTGMMPHNVPGSQHSNPTDSYYSSTTQLPVPLPDQGLTNGSGYSHYNSSTTVSSTVPSQYNPYSMSYSGYSAFSGSYLPSTMYGQPIMSTTMVSSGTVPSQNWPDSSTVYPKTPVPRQTIPVVSGRS